jgi:hypothetical protein
MLKIKKNKKNKKKMEQHRVLSTSICGTPVLLCLDTKQERNCETIALFTCIYLF